MAQNGNIQGKDWNGEYNSIMDQFLRSKAVYFVFIPFLVCTIFFALLIEVLVKGKNEKKK